MTLPAILAAAFLSLYQDPSAFAQPQAVAELTRLALTPTIDGQIHAETKVRPLFNGNLESCTLQAGLKRTANWWSPWI
jgi:hypothetical protein